MPQPNVLKTPSRLAKRVSHTVRRVFGRKKDKHAAADAEQLPGHTRPMSMPPPSTREAPTKPLVIDQPDDYIVDMLNQPATLRRQYGSCDSLRVAVAESRDVSAPILASTVGPTATRPVAGDNKRKLRTDGRIKTWWRRLRRKDSHRQALAHRRYSLDNVQGAAPSALGIGRPHSVAVSMPSHVAKAPSSAEPVVAPAAQPATTAAKMGNAPESTPCPSSSPSSPSPGPASSNALPRSSPSLPQQHPNDDTAITAPIPQRTIPNSAPNLSDAPLPDRSGSGLGMARFGRAVIEARSSMESARSLASAIVNEGGWVQPPSRASSEACPQPLSRTSSGSGSNWSSVVARYGLEDGGDDTFVEEATGRAIPAAPCLPGSTGRSTASTSSRSHTRHNMDAGSVFVDTLHLPMEQLLDRKNSVSRERQASTPALTTATAVEKTSVSALPLRESLSTPTTAATNKLMPLGTQPLMARTMVNVQAVQAHIVTPSVSTLEAKSAVVAESKTLDADDTLVGDIAPTSVAALLCPAKKDVDDLAEFKGSTEKTCAVSLDAEPASAESQATAPVDEGSEVPTTEAATLLYAQEQDASVEQVAVLENAAGDIVLDVVEEDHDTTIGSNDATVVVEVVEMPADEKSSGSAEPATANTIDAIDADPVGSDEPSDVITTCTPSELSEEHIETQEDSETLDGLFEAMFAEEWNASFAGNDAPASDGSLLLFEAMPLGSNAQSDQCQSDAPEDETTSLRSRLSTNMSRAPSSAAQDLPMHGLRH
ncbi:hypothetical protein THASP1DRAFT_23340 [Thamnocephalis sphaerospora]|uniref:Uncharacterized protein n=1 Tax=Thamnocephalis sphaerospora TaxID=78915 RepID=A0A4V1IWT9_9FUNG|nr:hypothetical protein THASP1DRAFT_23340 [Thamnocephalis sphaerospora]|eukprot:RKP08719.1 hypothetical protein THASP1DRAFT_23340 [Thamnocephalis sphaerospora]